MAQRVSDLEPTDTVAKTLIEMPEPSRMAPRASYPFGWTRRDLRHTIGLSLTAILAIIFLWQVQSVLPPFLIAFALAALLDPTLRHLQQHGRSRVRAILTLYVFGLVMVIAFGVLVVPPVRDQLADLIGNFSKYSDGLQQTANAFLKTHSAQLRLLGIRDANLQALLSAKRPLLQASAAAALGGVALFLQALVGKALWLIIIPISTFFLMRDYPLIRARTINLFPETYHEQIDIMSREIVDVFSAYLRGLSKICALYAVTAVIMFFLLGVRYWLFLGLMAGAFYAVPYVGQLFTALGSGAVAYLMEQHSVMLMFHPAAHSTGYALLVILCAIVAQNIFDQLVYPRVVGASVGLHPVVSIFALASGATLFGVIGMLTAVPVAASIQIILTFCFPKLTQPPPTRLLDPPPLA